MAPKRKPLRAAVEKNLREKAKKSRFTYGQLACVYRRSQSYTFKRLKCFIDLNVDCVKFYFSRQGKSCFHYEKNCLQYSQNKKIGAVASELKYDADLVMKKKNGSFVNQKYFKKHRELGL